MIKIKILILMQTSTSESVSDEYFNQANKILKTAVDA